MLSKREYFDKLIQSSLDGIFPSFNKELGGCFYRQSENPTCKERCAIGILIPDCFYCTGMENLAIQDLLNQFPYLKKYINIENISINDLSDIQICHDILAKIGWDHQKFVDSLLELCCFKEFREDINVKIS